VPAALAAVGLASLAAAAALAAALGLSRGRSGWEGLFVALNPGLIGAAVHDLAEPLAAALLLGGVAAYVAGRRGPAWICFALLPLAKEPLILVLLAVVVWELVHRRGRRAAVLATAAIPALLWWGYARMQLGAWFTSGDSALAAPLSGWQRAFHVALSTHGHAAAVPILAALLVLLSIAAVRALRLRGPVELAYLTLAAIAVCLAANATIAPSTALRNTAFLVVLVPFVLTSPPLRPRVRV
jgi:hypothetical protein